VVCRPSPGFSFESLMITHYVYPGQDYAKKMSCVTSVPAPARLKTPFPLHSGPTIACNSPTPPLESAQISTIICSGRPAVQVSPSFRRLVHDPGPECSTYHSPSCRRSAFRHSRGPGNRSGERRREHPGSSYPGRRLDVLFLFLDSGCHALVLFAPIITSTRSTRSPQDARYPLVDFLPRESR